MNTDLVVPSADAVDGGVPLEEVDGLAEVGEEVGRDVEVLLQDDHILRRRVDVERRGQRSLDNLESGLGCVIQEFVCVGWFDAISIQFSYLVMLRYASVAGAHRGMLNREMGGFKF